MWCDIGMLYFITFVGSLVAGIIQTVTGFGSGIFLMMIMPAFFDLVQAPSLVGSITVILGVYISFIYRKRIIWGLVLPPIIFYMVGTIIAIMLIPLLNLELLSFCFGIFLVLLAVFMSYSENNRISTSKFLSTVLCTAGGFFSGLFSSGGPLTAIYFLNATDSHDEYIANGQFLFMTTSIITFLLRITKGFYTMDLLPYTGIGIFGIVSGTYLGIKITGKLNGTKIKRIIYMCVGLCGIVTLLQ